MPSEQSNTDIGWAVVELMGHRRLGGYVREQTIAGAAFLRLDMFDGEGEDPAMTQLYSAAAVYCITPVSEEMARAVKVRPQPVARWELPPAEPEPFNPEDEPGLEPAWED
jgi:hypothetical protein